MSVQEPMETFEFSDFLLYQISKQYLKILVLISELMTVMTIFKMLL
jgi:hypothetical protein